MDGYKPTPWRLEGPGDKMRRTLVILFVLLSGSAWAQSTIVVSATGTNATIDNAIDYAVGIWEQRLVSPVPIKINITMLNMGGGGTLGYSIPNYLVNFSGAPMADTWYPASLANALAGTELNSGESDMDIFLNINSPYYYGTDGQPGNNEYDFVTILLHEIGHGLGISSFARSDSVLGSFGSITAADFLPMVPSFTFPNLNDMPSVWDRFLEGATTNLLTDTTLYPNYSTALHNELVSGAVYFTGPVATAANGLVPLQLFAPATFILGGSISHFDPAVFPITGGDGLMIPSIAPQEVDHEPGTILLGALTDIGWTTVVGMDEPGEDEPVKLFPNPMVQQATLEFNNPDKEIHTLSLYDIHGRPVNTITNITTGSVAIKKDNLAGGLYFFQLHTNIRIRATGKLIIK